MPCSRSISCGDAIGSATCDIVAEPLQPPNDVDAAAVAEVGHIFLEGQAEDQRASRLAPPVVERVGDPRAHPVVGLASGEDDLRVMADLLRQGG